MLMNLILMQTFGVRDENDFSGVYMIDLLILP